ncbi:TusE/DsrC/DsvC family sulfur relay protein [Rickettsiella endosymbiont of Litargus connexus]|uniref:TusE/DsrC/DsvC family sulfur relay protein n=1 Tax=Rickettsiella endosymbiont of Litargus connexus TaxID=3066237 RepID=UPI00376ED795|nr:TusE/DsrC/DsvC family sulfur relay protein [Candidatus Rickettsiella isopodorum]
MVTLIGLIVNGEEILTDQFGYLVHSADWHEEVAIKIAKDEALTLIKDHWHVIYFLRNFYQQYHKTPPIRILVNQLAVQLGPEKACSIYLNNLFPKGILKQASKLAGLPRPTRCM